MIYITNNDRFLCIKLKTLQHHLSVSPFHLCCQLASLPSPPATYNDALPAKDKFFISVAFIFLFLKGLV